MFESQGNRGATFSACEGWNKPADYGDWLAEYRAVWQTAGLLDRCELGRLAISGSDRLSWLQGMVSNDVRSLGQGQGSVTACVLNATGHLLADVRLIAWGDRVIAEMARSNVEKICQLWDRFVITEDVEIVDVSDEVACMSLQGPNAIAIWDDYTVRIAATFYSADHSGSNGLDILVDVSEAAGLWNHLADAGAIPVGERASEALRIEAGIPRYGVDMDEATIPLECNLEASHISYTKGCYIGQEIIARIQSRGHTNRTLTGLVISGDALPRTGDRLTVNSEAQMTLADSASTSPESLAVRDIGWVTSSTWSPLMGGPIALGYIRHEFGQVGTHLQIKGASGLLEARVTNLPFSVAI